MSQAPTPAVQPKPPSAKSALEKFEATISTKDFLEKLGKFKAINPEVFSQVLTNQVRKNPKIADCTPISVYDALYTLATLGLAPDGRNAHLIPFQEKNKQVEGRWVKGDLVCQLIIDYKGLQVITFRNGQLSKPIFSAVVCENDVFEWSIDRIEKHTYSMTVDRGAIIGSYAIASFNNGGELIEICTRKDLDKARAASKNSDGKNAPWVLWEDAMCRKTAVRKIAKMLDINPSDSIALDKAEETEYMDGVTLLHAPRAAVVPLAMPAETTVQISAEETELVKAAEAVAAQGPKALDEWTVKLTQAQTSMIEPYFQALVEVAMKAADNAKTEPKETAKKEEPKAAESEAQTTGTAQPPIEDPLLGGVA